MKLAALMAFILTLPAVAAGPFELRDGDRVALLGGTFFEGDYEHGHIETALTAGCAARNVTFRNLGWSADTVQGHSRSYFGPPAEGIERLRGHLVQIKPTVLVCNYGAAESWNGPDKLPEFLDGYRRLLDLAGQAAPSARLVLVSPAPAESLSPPFPNLDEHNKSLGVYRDAIKALATERGAAFFDLYQRILDAPKPHPLTINGIVYSAEGYRFVADLLDGDGRPAASQFPTPASEKLRALIVEKNRLFFHRWRPANETYLFGFRKHEQGRNSAEIPLFDPLIEAKEKLIAAALSPPP
jgi:lysophospholipase L1-like esterase